MIRHYEFEPRPRRTAPDTFRTGYTTGPEFVISKFEGPKIVKPPTEKRMKIAQRDLRDLKFEDF
ncbi:MAG: hypothetical protein HYT08_00710 [Candidatus Levybacteria bacterium]|nr:hypothetical protein [Candidatus Levybacteria bacterium]